MLKNYNSIVLLVASILLILGLIIIGISIAKSVENSAYPPVISDCPDYWDVSYNSAKQKICIKNSINTSPNISDASCVSYPTALYSVNGSSIDDIICEKSKWAKKCNVQWDGISNNLRACKKTTINNI